MRLSDGTEVDLRLSVARLMKLEQSVGKPLAALAQDMDSGKLGMKAIVSILEAGCASKEDAARIVNDLDNQGIGTVSDVIAALFRSSMGEKGKDEASASGNVQEPVEVT